MRDPLGQPAQWGQPTDQECRTIGSGLYSGTPGWEEKERESPNFRVILAAVGLATHPGLGSLWLRIRSAASEVAVG